MEPDYFYNDSYLTGNFSNLGIRYDRMDKLFIAMIESKEIDGVQVSWYESQFHPKKVQYQFTSKLTPNFKHDINSVLINISVSFY